MTNPLADNSAKQTEEKKEDRVFRFTIFPPSYEVRGYDTQDTLILLRKTWWLYLLMLIAVVGVILVTLYLKDGSMVLISGLLSTWLKNKSP